MVLKKEQVRACLSDVPREQAFWCEDGREFKNLEELAGALAGMSPETYGHHVSGNNNDFSNWVRDVVGDATLANQLARATSRIAAAKVASARVTWLKERL
jgi:hypothetical protein